MTSPSKHSTAKKWQRSEKTLLTVSTLLFVLCIGGFFASQRANDLPQIAIPTPAMPSPNARDYYVPAGKGTAYGNERNDRDQKKYSRVQKQKFLAANAANLRRFREGMRYPYRNDPARSLKFPFADYASLRELARLVSYESDVRAESGDWGGATQSAIDGIKLGQDIPRGGLFISGMVGYACEAIARRGAFTAARQVNAADARAAALRLERMARNRVPFAETIQEEKWYTQAALLDLFKTMTLTQAVQAIGQSGSGGTQSKWSSIRETLNWQVQLMRYGKKGILENGATYMDAQIARAKLPYPQRQVTPSPSLPPDAINQIFLFHLFDAIALKETDARMQYSLLTVAFALRAYRLERGGYPVALEELVTNGYLKQLPDVPFAASGPLRYRRAGANSYRLYSVGPDSRDDGGKPIDNRERNGKQRRFVEANTRGDFVEGVNTY